MPTLSQYEALHLKNISFYGRKVLAIYHKYIDLIFAKAQSISIPAGATFDINKYPVLKNSLTTLGKKMQDELKTVIVNGVKGEWSLANKKNDDWMALALKDKDIPKVIYERFFDTNLGAMQQFIERKESGLTLSDRVWNVNSQFRTELEGGLQYGITNGTPAARMASDMKGYLNNPDKLFRRIKNEQGELKLSKPAQQYHPGQGQYRSSYKNALRVTGTETNMAYRMSDHKRWQNTGFVLGFEVKLSGNHPVPDICDDLAGEYPKEFIFRGWHPQCRCYAVPLKPDEQTFGDYLDSIKNGESFDFTGQVEDPPAGLTQWMNDNKDRIAGWKNVPYFMKDNPGFIKIL